jgi:HPt (histidine-containing phosphotransfer) domain-containing protein
VLVISSIDVSAETTMLLENPTPDTDKQLFDLVQLSEALDLFGEGIHTTLQQLQSNADQAFTAMERAVNESNSKLMKDAAHKFKGSLSILGCAAAAEAALQLELLGHNGEVIAENTNTAGLIAQLKASYDQSFSRLLQITAGTTLSP